jgi:hypothetical protein
MFLGKADVKEVHVDIDFIVVSLVLSPNHRMEVGGFR